MSHMTFFKLCNLLRPYIKCQTTHMHCTISVETQVAVTMYYLSDKGRLRKVAKCFQDFQGSSSIIVRKVSWAIATQLGPCYIKLPVTEESVKEKGFEILTLF